LTQTDQIEQVQNSTVTYVDRPEIQQVYVDVPRSVWADGPIVHIEFCANRFTQPDPTRPGTINQVTSARLVMPLPCALTLLNHLKQMEQNLLAAGAIKQVHVPDTSGRAN
jgi:hypothetical protein